MSQSKSRKHETKRVQQWELPAGSHVWVYLRHSPGDEQTIESQQSGMREWASQLGLIVDHEFIDEAAKGGNDNREQFQEMIRMGHQKPRPVDGILLWDFGRFARNLLDAQFHKAELRRLGFVVLSKIDDIPNSDMAPLIEAFIDWKNERYVKDLQAAIIRGHKYAVEQGFWTSGRAPIGYTIEKIEMGLRPSGSMRYGNHLVKDQSVADRIALAWHMKLYENASYLDICEVTHLVPNPSGFVHFFSNLIYAGIYEYGGKRYPLDWEKGARFCESYVSLEEFYQVQANRDKRHISVIAPRALASDYLLSGLLHCGDCARQGRRSKLVGMADRYKDATYRHYRCRAKSDAQYNICSTPSCATWRIERPIMTLLRETVFTQDFVTNALNEANKLLAESSSTMHIQLADAERALTSVQKRLENVINLITEKGKSPLLDIQYDTLHAQWVEASARLSSLRSQPQVPQSEQISVTDVQAFLDDMLGSLDSGTIRQQRELIAHFVDHVDVYSDYMDVWLSFRLPDAPHGKIVNTLFPVYELTGSSG